jgi:type II secretory ATPase GspE/PulE/Tfp pilus assembly ATPase PilB-like protein
MNINFDWSLPCAVWCKECNDTWYKWRFAIIEAFEITEDIKMLISEWRSEVDLYSKAREQWFLSLKEDGILKMLEWKTTLDELRRIL